MKRGEQKIIISLLKAQQAVRDLGVPPFTEHVLYVLHFIFKGYTLQVCPKASFEQGVSRRINDLPYSRVIFVGQRRTMK